MCKPFHSGANVAVTRIDRRVTPRAHRLDTAATQERARATILHVCKIAAIGQHQTDKGIRKRHPLPVLSRRHAVNGIAPKNLRCHAQLGYLLGHGRMPVANRLVLQWRRSGKRYAERTVGEQPPRRVRKNEIQTAGGNPMATQRCCRRRTPPPLPSRLATSGVGTRLWGLRAFVRARARLLSWGACVGWGECQEWRGAAL